MNWTDFSKKYRIDNPIEFFEDLETATKKIDNDIAGLVQCFIKAEPMKAVRIDPLYNLVEGKEYIIEEAPDEEKACHSEDVYYLPELQQYWYKRRFKMLNKEQKVQECDASKAK